MACEIERLGGKIIKGAKATKIITEGNRVTKVVTEQNGSDLNSGRRVFLIHAGKGPYCRDGGRVRCQRVALELPYRDFMTVGLLVKAENREQD